MTPAAHPRASSAARRLLVVDPARGALSLAEVGELATVLRPGDALVVNDSATFPASLTGVTDRGEPIELRLLAPRNETWTAIAFGGGDWRTRTEDRPAPPSLLRGAHLAFGADDARLEAEVVRQEGRHLVVRFSAAPARFWPALYRLGRPVQYAHVTAPLALWDVQTPYASRPWSSEMPSAGLPLNGALLLALRRRRVAITRLTHAAGLSATGDDALDRALPFPERFDVPADTLRSLARTRADGGRVFAVGTSVTRALESCATSAPLTTGITDLVIGPGHQLRAVDGLLTGLHDPGTSHFALLTAFAPAELLTRALDRAAREGLTSHEYGDAMLILPRARGARAA